MALHRLDCSPLKSLNQIFPEILIAVRVKKNLNFAKFHLRIVSQVHQIVWLLTWHSYDQQLVPWQEHLKLFAEELLGMQKSLHLPPLVVELKTKLKIFE